MSNVLQGKWALITGSSRGIGQQIALGLSEHGCNIIVHGRTKNHTLTTMKALKNYPVETLAIEGDLSQKKSIKYIQLQLEQNDIEVDILYNNAGIQGNSIELWQTSTEDWHHIFQINFFAMVEMCRAFAPKMKASGYGRIINLSSGIKDIPQFAPYSASKAALDKYTLDLAAELKGTNVLVNTLDPGWIKTDMGGPDAPNEINSLLPGALIPALLADFGDSGMRFSVQKNDVT